MIFSWREFAFQWKKFLVNDACFEIAIFIAENTPTIFGCLVWISKTSGQLPTQFAMLRISQSELWTPCWKGSFLFVCSDASEGSNPTVAKESILWNIAENMSPILSGLGDRCELAITISIADFNSEATRQSRCLNRTGSQLDVTPWFHRGTATIHWDGKKSIPSATILFLLNYIVLHILRTELDKRWRSRKKQITQSTGWWLATWLSPSTNTFH